MTTTPLEIGKWYKIDKHTIKVESVKLNKDYTYATYYDVYGTSVFGLKSHIITCSSSLSAEPLARPPKPKISFDDIKVDTWVKLKKSSSTLFNVYGFDYSEFRVTVKMKSGKDNTYVEHKFIESSDNRLLQLVLATAEEIAAATQQVDHPLIGMCIDIGSRQKATLISVESTGDKKYFKVKCIRLKDAQIIEFVTSKLDVILAQ